jgi:plasmid stabilization system protein ParE
MMYSAHRADLEKIFHWLQSNDESQWDEQTRLLSETVSTLQDVAHPQTKSHEPADRPASESARFSAEANAINVALPEMMQMLGAMHIRNRELAIKHGEAALGLLPVG